MLFTALEAKHPTVRTLAIVNVAFQGMRRTSLLFGVSVLQFCIATAHVAVCTQWSIVGLLYSPNPGLYYQNQGESLHLVQVTLYFTNVSFLAFQRLMIAEQLTILSQNSIADALLVRRSSSIKKMNLIGLE